LTDFIGSARTLLTKSVYPNLQNGSANDAARETLRSAIRQLGGDIATGRDNLERAYRDRADRH
jgi:hypothetical protein